MKTMYVSKGCIKQDDVSLLEAMKSGSWEAFEMLYDKYWERLFQISVSVTGDDELSKDFVQEIFLDLWNRRESLTINNPFSYLYQATKYQFIEYIRKQELQKNYLQQFNEVLNATNDVESKIYYDELRTKIDNSIEELPPKCKEIFRLSRFQHLTNQEIANRLGISKSTVENQIHKALNHLKKSPELDVALMLAVFMIN
ncbi:RNA polymerase sigma-70 factor [Echinicola sediminis]